jgi:hypothetical protein
MIDATNQQLHSAGLSSSSKATQPNVCQNYYSNGYQDLNKSKQAINQSKSEPSSPFDRIVTTRGHPPSGTSTSRTRKTEGTAGKSTRIETTRAGTLKRNKVKENGKANRLARGPKTRNHKACIIIGLDTASLRRNHIQQSLEANIQILRSSTSERTRKMRTNIHPKPSNRYHAQPSQSSLGLERTPSYHMVTSQSVECRAGCTKQQALHNSFARGSLACERRKH